MWLQKKNREWEFTEVQAWSGTIRTTLKVMEKNQWEGGKRQYISVLILAFFFLFSA